MFQEAFINARNIYMYIYSEKSLTNIVYTKIIWYVYHKKNRETLNSTYIPHNNAYLLYLVAVLIARDCISVRTH